MEEIPLLVGMPASTCNAIHNIVHFLRRYNRIDRHIHVLFQNSFIICIKA